MKQDNHVNIMCDLETTGVSPGCCILSIALVPFSTDYPLDTFYETISHKDSLSEGFTDNAETLAWWDKQRPDIQQEAFSGTRSVRGVLKTVSHYLAEIGEPKNIILWGNGKDFDNVILAHAFKHLGIKQPWHYKNKRCYRELDAYFPMWSKGSIKDAHNALQDALAQARHAEVIIEAARKLTPMKI